MCSQIMAGQSNREPGMHRDARDQLLHGQTLQKDHVLSSVWDNLRKLKTGGRGENGLEAPGWQTGREKKHLRRQGGAA